MPSVFISYSHDSDAHRDFVRGIADHLRRDGVDCLIDQYINGFPPAGWQRWMEDQIESADFVLLVCTETYLRRFRGHETQSGKGVNFEGVVISQTLYDSYYQNTKFILVIPETGDFDHVPVPLRPYTPYRLNSQYEDIYRIITKQAKYQPPNLGDIRNLPAAHIASSHRIYSDDLPTVEGKLFGRKDELALLDQAMSNPDTHIVQFVASGGTGKTKLIRTWLDDNADKIGGLIAWSFYSQGSSEDKQISATPFFMQALKSLGSDKDISDFNTEEEKGEHIADLLREKRCLLVLDGLEPLQQIGRGMRGELKDRAIRKLLRCLVGSHSSLCIITTRLAVHDLKGRRQVVSSDLQNLKPKDGVALLSSLGVQGGKAYQDKHDQLLEAVKEYGCHALTIFLLGNALRVYLEGNVLHRHKLPGLLDDKKVDRDSQHAFRVMQAYIRWLKGTPELKLLYLIGIFEHPIDTAALHKLWDAQIPDLTQGITQADWKRAYEGLLNDHHLIFTYPDNEHLMDCHPLVREFFSLHLKENFSDAWKQAHQCLYIFYNSTSIDKYPTSIEGMRPLFNAVVHGCKAGLHKQVLEEIYWNRIKRQNKHYLTRKLGAISDDLSVLANFFESPWTTPVKSLDNTWSAGVLNWAGFRLRALGRLEEAEIPMQKAVTYIAREENWESASFGASSLCELQLTMGEISTAINSAKLSILYADQSEDVFCKMAWRATLAHALHQACKLSESEAFFQIALKIQKKREPNYPALYSMLGYYYYEYLLTIKDYKTAFRHATLTLEWAKLKKVSLLDTALQSISLGKIYFAMNTADAHPKALQESQVYVAKGVDLLRKAEERQYLPVGLLAQSTLRRLSQEYLPANDSLQEAYEIAEPSGMRLHLTDYHLEMARLILAVEADPTQYPEATPNREQRTLPFADQEEPGILTLEGHIAKADRLIQETGYHRRDAELAELKQAIGEQ